MGLMVPNQGTEFPQNTPQQGNAEPGGGTFGAVNQSSRSVNDMVTKMLTLMLKPKTSLQQPTVAASENDLSQNKYIMGNQGSNMGEVGAALSNFGTAIHNAVAAHKEKQIRVAMADYSGLQAAWESAETIAQGDPTKARTIFEADPRTQGILGDPKKMKNLAKAFSMDLLKPEKTTVYGDALKRHLQADRAGKVVKALRMIGMMRQGEPQLNDEQRKQMVHEEAGKLPMVTQQPSDKTMAEAQGIMQRQQEYQQRVVQFTQTMAERQKEFEQRMHDAQARLEEKTTNDQERRQIMKDMEGIRQQQSEMTQLNTLLKLLE